MVFVNDKKFACEACIKGHRSSSCSHADRPLYEIKKKGRPVSQCTKCRELRSTKRVHSKCSCGDSAKPRVREGEKSFGTKQKRYIPVMPTLPNGLQDVFEKRRDAENENAGNPRQRVDALLNPCHCVDLWSCKCSASPLAEETSEGSSSGLSTLARAAELFAKQSSSTSTQLSPQPTPKSRKRRLSPTPLPERTKPKPKPARGPSLPPIAFPPLVTSLAGPPLAPPEMPSFNTFRSLAGSGCTCGLQCSCPGCAEHAQDGEPACGDDCGHCVDPTVREVDLSTAGFSFSTSAASSFRQDDSSVIRSSVLDHFFSHAAKVPPPPVPGGAPVALPKLCCGGSCGCGTVCGCGSSCDGCCLSGQAKESAPAIPVTAQPKKKSCCAK